ncbi:MAG: P-loop NTPase [Candidatus Aenigmarchaeota archaeon]|nr:P-loop NTPase [Candidatus Aenigmarchaeota archaeon]
MARFIGVVSGKGGVGKTTVVSNLSYALNELGQRVIAVDCNVTTPHLSNYMPNFSWRTTLNDVMKKKADIFSALHYANGVYVVPASLNLADLVDVDITTLRETVQPLANINSLVLLDSAPGLGKEALSVLHSCEEILFVTIPQKSAVNDILRCAEVAEEIGLKRLGLVLNMYRKKKYNLAQEEIEEITGLKVIGNISFDEKVIQAISSRSPLVKSWPESKVSQEFMKLAANLINIPYKRQGKISRMINRLFRRNQELTSRNYPILHTTNKDLTTAGDKILDLLAANKKMKISEVAEKVNLSEEEIYKWGKILEEQRLLSMQPSIFGIKKSKLVWND